MKPLLTVLILLCYYAALAGFVKYRLQWTPQPLAADAPSDLFSEQRALDHVRRLTVSGRLVSHPAIEDAVQYIVNYTEALAAEATSRSDVVVEVERQQVTGGINMVFLEERIANAYNNLTNVVLTITPRNASTEKAVLVSAHYDSLIGTVGASDCASQVGVMLETARVLLSRHDMQLAAPLMFVFIGGEETFSQAAHGFMQQNERPLGLFLNLESTGPGGPDYVFQHTGGWVAMAYAKAAKYPRGASLGQDIFDTGLLPADSDYRMYSYEHYGNMPGLDIAFLLDGAAYHTDRDTVDRIRTGTLQAMGENLITALPELAVQMAHERAADLLAGKAVFFDVLGYFMVSYSHARAKLLHSLPLIFVLTTPLLRGSLLTKPPGLLQLGCGALACFASWVLAVLVPALLGMARVLVFGNPMVWYSQHAIAFAMYMPAAVAGALMPSMVFPLDHRGALMGTALLLGGFAALMTAVGLGSGFLLALWACAAILATPTQPKVIFVAVRKVAAENLLLWLLIPSAFPVVMSLPFLLLLANILMDKASLLGVLPPPLGPAVSDAIVGAVIGLGIAVCTSAIIPWVGTVLSRRHIKILVLALMLSAVGVASWASSSCKAYDVEAPKRLLVQHAYLHEAGYVTDSMLIIGGSDAVDVCKVFDVANYQQRNSTYRDWQSMYPLTSRLGGVVLDAPGARDHYLTEPPSIELRNRVSHDSYSTLHFTLKTREPCWGVLNITGHVLRWSFTDGLPATAVSEDGGVEHIVRIAGNTGSESWPFSVDVAAGGHLHVELSITFWDRMLPAMRSFVTQLMPEWTSLLLGTTYMSAWTFR